MNNDKLFQQKMTANMNLWQQYVISRLITINNMATIYIVDNKKKTELSAAPSSLDSRTLISKILSYTSIFSCFSFRLPSLYFFDPRKIPCKV